MTLKKIIPLCAIALAASSTQALAENTFRWTSQGDALTLDPHSQNEGPTVATAGMIYESLVTRDTDLVLQPELAQSWEPMDGNIWRFTLREGVKFQGGEDFTAEDVAFSIARAKHEKSDFKEQVGSITEVIVVDDFTIDLVTEEIDPILPNKLTSFYIMDKGWSEANNVATPQDFAGKEETFAVRNTNGTGPFKLVSRAPDELTVMEKNTDWWAAGQFPTNIDRIEYRPIANAATRVAALLSDEVDFILDPPLQDLKRIEAADGLKTSTVPQIRTIFFGMDQGIDELRTSNIKGENPFADVRVREAMNLAIDRKAIQRVVMEGLSFPAGMVTSPGVLGNTPEQDAEIPLDVDKAKSLLADAGYPDGFSVQLDCPNNRYINDEKICQAAVSMLSKIGVDVSLDAIPKAQHFPKIQNRTTDFYMLGWGVPTLDSHYVFSYLLDAEGSWNAADYNNESVNSLIKAMASETDLAKREQMIDEAWTQVRKDMPYIPIHHQVIAWGMSDNVDTAMSADDALRPRFITMK